MFVRTTPAPVVHSETGDLMDFVSAILFPSNGLVGRAALDPASLVACHSTTAHKISFYAETNSS